VTTRRPTLKYDVFVTSPEPTVTNLLPHGREQRLFPPIAATLISGEQEAVLVDALLTVGQAGALADWVAAQGKHLMAVYITHGHGDHWFGLSVIRARFPDARACALPAVIERMRQDAASPYWKQQFPGKLPEHLVFAEPLPDHTLALEGHDLVAVELGHTDTDDTTCLHVPEIGLLVTGDSVYNDVHLHLEESDLQGRRDWLAALDTMEALRPRAVIAGHQRAGRHDGPEILEETRQYIRDFDRLAQTTQTALALYDEMLALYPERINRVVLWSSARAQIAHEAPILELTM
jgi:glyoxylase-like metal-dependent hydrolase (beta-lactamase superfamily II)